MGGMSDGMPVWRPDTPCPHLPSVEGQVTAASMQAFRLDRGADFYRAALRYAQSLWLEGKPAQAILQLNKALSADLPDPVEVLAYSPWPYDALKWILEQNTDGAFLGNPVRHFQHLASRMSGPRKEVRVWRAWACFHLSEASLDSESFPRDLEQMDREGLIIPELSEVLDALEEMGWPGEARQVAILLGEADEGCAALGN